ncbi:alpha/beta hydrolase fold domain-containing protein [Delftia sp.]|uniref:alpha/beta hydrolase n=1 Tax=Delftia sp. TaxID=1886637 RepID=UPI00259CEC65|nr:alpha/beta hydrolase fold domain-containing protein [Delftia sp.]
MRHRGGTNLSLRCARNTWQAFRQATVISCEYDPLRDEAEAYAQRLAQSGVAVKAVRLSGMVHACMHMLGLAPASRRLFDEAGAAVRQAFGTAIG